MIVYYLKSTYVVPQRFLKHTLTSLPTRQIIRGKSLAFKFGLTKLPDLRFNLQVAV